MPTRASRIITALAVLLVLVGYSGESIANETAVRKALSTYLDAVIGGDSDTAYSSVSAEDRAQVTLLEHREQYVDPIDLAFWSRTSYKIVSIELKELSASAQVDMTFPNREAIGGTDYVFELLPEITMSLIGLSEEEIAERGEEIRERIAAAIREKKELPTITEAWTYPLVREADGWKVYRDWKTNAAIEKLIAEAESLEGKGDFAGAVVKYEGVLSVDPEAYWAREKTVELHDDVEKQAYRDKISVYDLKGKYVTTEVVGKVPGVKFKLRNIGDRVVTMVKVVVYFKDAKGVIVAEEPFYPVSETHPVRATFPVDSYPSGMGPHGKPLKPNYVWEGTPNYKWEKGARGYYLVESVPSEWKAGSLAAEVVEVDFE